MKLPNGYGSVVKLSGKRRKPYAVRISVFGDVDGIPVRHRKYLEYFTTRKEALAYLADYNKGLAVTEHTNYSDLLTFKDLFNKWVDWKWSFNKHPGPAALKCYKSAFKQYAPLHDRKVATLRASDLQDCLTAARSKSASTVSHMGVIVRGMWKYAISNEYLDRDITIGLVYESTTPEAPSIRVSPMQKFPCSGSLLERFLMLILSLYISIPACAAQNCWRCAQRTSTWISII